MSDKWTLEEQYLALRYGLCLCGSPRHVVMRKSDPLDSSRITMSLECRADPSHSAESA